MTHTHTHTHRGEPRIARMIAVGVPFHGSYFDLVGLIIILYILCTYVERPATGVLFLMALLTCVRAYVCACLYIVREREIIYLSSPPLPSGRRA